jgi:two-component system response regulator HydG
VLFGHTRGAFTGAVADRMGKFEFADGDTIILDEIGDLPLDQQAKLLRVLQERTIERVGSNTEIEVDVRVIAVTNRDLAADVRAGRFRADLLYRLKVVTIFDPPLREHMEDLPVIAEHSLCKHCARHGRLIKKISPAAMNLLMNHNWPGNARELDAAVEGAVVIEESAAIQPSSLVLGPTGSQTVLAALDYVLKKPYPQARECLDLIYLITRYIKAGGNASEASKLSGAPRKLFSRIRKVLSGLGMNIDAGQHIDWLDLLRRLDETPMSDEDSADGQDDTQGNDER